MKKNISNKSNSVKKSLSYTVTEYLDMPKETLDDTPYIRMIGNEEIHIENFLGIQVYTEVCIKLKTSCGFLNIEGNQLEAKYMDSQGIIIRGKIRGVAFSI